MKKGTTATIFNDSFLLETKLANTLYHSYAAGLPIIDYHNHLVPQQIADDHQGHQPVQDDGALAVTGHAACLHWCRHRLGLHLTPVDTG